MIARTLNVGAQRRVLVVDDNRELAELVRSHFVAQHLGAAVAHTAADAIAAYTSQAYDALVVDLLLPDQTGHWLLEQLARRGPLPPVFVITGVFRGAAIRAQLGAITAVAGWFEKPFDFRLLSQSVCQALGKRFESGTNPQAAAVEQALRVYDAARPIGRSTASFAGVGAAPEAQGTVPGRLRSAVSRRQRSSAPATDGGRRLPGPRTPDPFRDAHTGYRRSTTPSATDMSVGLRTQLRAGDLRQIPAARLLGAFHVARETGEVAFEAGPRRQIVYIEGGRPLFARSNQKSDQLGALLAEALGLDGSALRSATTEAKQTARTLEDVMLARGWIDSRGLEHARRAHTRRLLLELLRWCDGEYAIRFRRRCDLPRAPMPEDVGTFVLQGVRDQVSLERLQALLPDHVRLMPSPNTPFPLYALPIHDAEAGLLLRVTGAKTVRQLVERAPPALDERRVRALLYGLLALGVLVSGRPPVGDGDEVGASARSPASASAG